MCRLTSYTAKAMIYIILFPPPAQYHAVAYCCICTDKKTKGEFMRKLKQKYYIKFNIICDTTMMKINMALKEAHVSQKLLIYNPASSH